MVITKRYISLLVLAVALFAGCNPGIIDVPPVQVTDASKYFWNAHSMRVTYLDSSIHTGGIFTPLTLSFSALGSSADTVSIDQINNGSVGDSLSYTLGAEEVRLRGISQHTIISLPDGYIIKPVEKIISVSYIPKLTRIVALSSKNVVAASDSSGIFYSSDGGQSWAKAVTDFGGISNPVTALTVKEDKVFAGTKSGKLYYSVDGGSSWTNNQSYNGEILAIAGFPEGNDILISVSGIGVFRSGGNTQGTMINSSNLTKNLNFKLLAASKDLIVGVTQSSLVYYHLVNPLKSDTDWHQPLITPKPGFIRSLVSTPRNNFYFSSENAIYMSETGYKWHTVDSGFGNSILASIKETQLVIAASPEGYLQSFVDSIGRSSGFYGSVNRAINDFAVSNTTFFAATDNGAYFSFDAGATWRSSVLGLVSSHNAKVKIPGEIVLLRSRSGSIALDSNWQADTIVNTKLNLTIPITAHIVSHLDQVVMPDSAQYPDVIEVEYSSDIPGTPSWQIYYAKDVGPIIIREVSGVGVLRKIYRRK